MITTYRKILNELLPSLQQLAQMQNQGMVHLPQKAAYAIGKNLGLINPFLKDFEKERHSALELTANFENGKPKIVEGEKGGKVFDWKEGGKAQYEERIEKWLDTEVTWTSYRMQKEVIEGIDNFPVQVHPILEEFEMLSELNIVTPKLVN